MGNGDGGGCGSGGGEARYYRSGCKVQGRTVPCQRCRVAQLDEEGNTWRVWCEDPQADYGYDQSGDSAQWQWNGSGDRGSAEHLAHTSVPGNCGEAGRGKSEACTKGECAGCGFKSARALGRQATARAGSAGGTQRSKRPTGQIPQGDRKGPALVRAAADCRALASPTALGRALCSLTAPVFDHGFTRRLAQNTAQRAFVSSVSPRLPASGRATGPLIALVAARHCRTPGDKTPTDRPACPFEPVAGRGRSLLCRAICTHSTCAAIRVHAADSPARSPTLWPASAAPSRALSTEHVQHAQTCLSAASLLRSSNAVLRWPPAPLARILTAFLTIFRQQPSLLSSAASPRAESVI
ncbi:uncharacterized protein CC84DRAFT_1202827 [Paraphaeosphaeria sporulosa]|uniref:Uncharacterized protein n=1 Tax=Paraphaeosphaeria sporulosa TaxID=1460663 RepID=A0A177CTM5_9PLEO|nr:uncharacterized protein CC84DRAFT_1202827 [Paraphaeosphaeria sporulosa]OAG10348.1 hypothetical protein CC84DRAFT_1202827 [Paraphaeosphaeria sporulosa]